MSLNAFTTIYGGFRDVANPQGTLVLIAAGKGRVLLGGRPAQVPGRAYTPGHDQRLSGSRECLAVRQHDRELRGGHGVDPAGRKQLLPVRDVDDAPNRLASGSSDSGPRLLLNMTWWPVATAWPAITCARVPAPIVPTRSAGLRTWVPPSWQATGCVPMAGLDALGCVDGAVAGWRSVSPLGGCRPGTVPASATP
jgi:hypothetical protein